MTDERLPMPTRAAKARALLLQGKLPTKADLVFPWWLEAADKMFCGLNCSGCGEYLETEGDFARHFYIPDIQYLNLGRCPVKDGVTQCQTSTSTAKD